MNINHPTAYAAAGMETALSGSTADYLMPAGNNIISRLDIYHNWVTIRNQTETWQYARIQESRPGPVITLRDAAQRKVNGLNFGSQDYLGLSAHPDVIQATSEALSKYGPHSAGSPLVSGQTDLIELLEDQLKELTGMEHVLIFPTGWAAGFGSITALAGKNDHIVMDALSHACLSQGAAFAAGKNVYKYPHLHHEAAKNILMKIRAIDTHNSILVVTEGIFSMNSDTPDIKQLNEICREYNATLMVDVAHDLGALGPRGSGQPGMQGMKGKTDLIMGSFSKSFASGGGFLATHSAAVKEYVKMFAGPFLFSNAISPLQTAAALQASRIILSAEGDMLRERLSHLSERMRSGFFGKSRISLGIPSAIVSIVVGKERNARLLHHLLRQRNIAAPIVEFPVVPLGEARLRLQLMATHTDDQIDLAVREISDAILEAEELGQIIYR